jgi:hypothetical protein
LHISWYLKSLFLNLKGTIQYQNNFLGTIQVFISTTPKTFVFIHLLSNMRLVPITQGCPKHHQKFSNRSLI